VSGCILQGNTSLMALDVSDNKMSSKLNSTSSNNMVILEQLIKQTTYKISKQLDNTIVIVDKL
ncbi:MAG: hypothetical protein PHS65_07955, partial [Arcobacteraceae bacterium]|nr:hypothetical protein [Arcobacteraceae bacterium]